METKTYKVREIATIITGRNAPDIIDGTIRRLRYWTNEGILQPIGRVHSGSGNYREYDIDEVRKAAITSELVRYGISITSLDPFGEYLDSLKNSDLLPVK